MAIWTSLPIPVKVFATYDSWEAENFIVMAWLINPMDTKIGRTYLYYKTAKDIREAVQAIYSDLENTTQCFGIHFAFNTTGKNTCIVT